MTSFKVLPLALAAIAGLTFVSAPAQARTPAEETHCRAVGQAFSTLGALEKEVAVTLRDALGANATAEDKKTADDLETLGAQSMEIGAALERNFAHAAAPSEAEVKALDDVSLDGLIEQAQQCVD